MVSNLAPILANVFMGFYKTKELNECNLNKPKIYPSKADDISAAFYNKHD